MTEITLDEITKVYGAGAAGFKALDRVAATIAPGEFFFLLGPSGCGKTTLLRIIAGLLAPTSGRLLFGGRDVTGLPAEKRNTAMVFQSYALWPHMTVAQNVAFAPRMKGLPAAERRRRTRASLERVQMAAFARRKPNQLSGGQQQRVAVARALAAEGDCLLLDEPLSNLDARLRMHMRGELRELVKSTGTTAVYVTHDQKEALSMADRVAVMDAGRIIQTGTPEDIYNRPATRFVADFLGEANFIPGRLEAEGDRLRVTTPAGTLLAQRRDGVPAPPADVLCCVRPEWVALAPAGRPSGGGAALEATVVSRMYLGDTCQYTCRLANGETWKVSMLSDSGQAPAEGLAEGGVRLVVEPADVILLPPDP